MNKILNDQFVAQVEHMRQAVIRRGGRPDTLRISKKAIEQSTIFGMKILVVDDGVLPDGVWCMVTDDLGVRHDN